MHQENEDRTIKKIICGYFIELWYAYRLWKLDFSKPAVLEFVTLTFFQYVCWKILLQNINQNRLWLKILVHKNSLWWNLQNKYITHNKVSPKWKDISGVKIQYAFWENTYICFFHYFLMLSFDILAMVYNLAGYRVRLYYNKMKKSYDVQNIREIKNSVHIQTVKGRFWCWCLAKHNGNVPFRKSLWTDDSDFQ